MIDLLLSIRRLEEFNRLFDLTGPISLWFGSQIGVHDLNSHVPKSLHLVTRQLVVVSSILNDSLTNWNGLLRDSLVLCLWLGLSFGVDLLLWFGWLNGLWLLRLLLWRRRLLDFLHINHLDIYWVDNDSRSGRGLSGIDGLAVESEQKDEEDQSRQMELKLLSLSKANLDLEGSELVLQLFHFEFVGDTCILTVSGGCHLSGELGLVFVLLELLLFSIDLDEAVREMQARTVVLEFG